MRRWADEYPIAGKHFLVETPLQEVRDFLHLVFGPFPLGDQLRESLPRERHGVADARGIRLDEHASELEAYRVEAQGHRVVVYPPASAAVSFPSGRLAAEYVQWHISQAALGVVGDSVALHAAALALPELNQRAILLVGPSGAGKSTLTLELVRAGFGFLSDEAVFLSILESTVAGFPRAIGLTSGEEPGSKRYLPPDEVGGCLIRGALPVDTVYFLAGFGTTTELRSIAAAEALRRLLGQVYADGPVESIVDGLVRLLSSAKLVEMVAGPAEDATDVLIAAHSQQRVA